MATVSESSIASAFLTELHAPDNALMRKAVIAWLRAESGRTIRGNNPWNMTLNAASETGIHTCGSWKSMSSGLTFAVFCSPQDGARASARLLLNAGHDWRNYDKVVSGARSGNPITFLNALARSAWDGGRYGTKNGGPNKLLGIFAGISGLGNDELDALGYNSSDASGATRDAGDKGEPIGPGAGTLNGTMLGAWGNNVQFPVGHILTAADVQEIMAVLYAKGFFPWNGGIGDVSASIVQGILLSKIGKPWNQALLGEIQKDSFSSADAAIPKTPLDPVLGVAGAVAQIVAALFDPRKWLLFLALIAGAGLTAWGGSNLARAAT